VRKRLEKEGLQDRCIMVTDINKDRQPVLQMIRDQAINLRRNPGSADAAVRRKRQQLAHLIEELEGQLDRRHEALHQADDETGLSYRTLLGELIELEADGPAPIDVPRLRGLLETLPAAQRAAPRWRAIGCLRALREILFMPSRPSTPIQPRFGPS
jgi:hypothetical protein